MNNSNSTKQGAIYGGVFLLLLIITLTLPLINLITVFLLPIPFILFTRQYGWQAGTILFAVTGVVSILLLTIYSLPFVIVVAAGGILTGLAMYHKRTPYETWAQGSAGFALGIGLLYVLTQFLFEVNWTDEIYQTVEESYLTYMQFMESFGTPVEPDVQEQLQAQAESLVHLIPTGMVISAVVLALVTQWLSYKWINRRENLSLRFPKFREFNLPVSVIWYFLIAIILSWIFTDPSDPFYIVGLNLYTMIGLLLLIQGLSFVFFYVHHRKWPRFIPFLVVILVAFFPLLFIFPLRILGIIDLGFQLRSRLTDNQSK